MKTRYWIPAASLLAAVACGPSNNGATNNGGTNNDTNNGTNNGATNNGATNNGATNNGETNNGGMNNEIPADPGLYSFPSRYVDGADSVAYSGQVGRQVLISDLNKFIGGLSDAIDNGSYQPGAAGSVVAALDFFYHFDGETYGSEPLLTTTEPEAEQTIYDDIATGKDLAGKLAGNDAVTDHKDWSTEFGGWSDATFASNGGDVSTPEGLLMAFFGRIETNALSRADGIARFAPDGVTELPVHVTEQGHDLQQLTQKFLLGAVNFSQGADDYLDDDIEGKGLLAANTQDEDAAYSSLEHQWDEGFGYFGAARNYLQYTDEEIAGKGGRDEWSSGYHDTDGNGKIDLTSEYNWGASTNAAKRDLGSATGTDYTKETFEAFWRGRAIIAQYDGDVLSGDDLAVVAAQRDIAVLGWEKSLAATVVHYINDTIEATEAIGTVEYDFLGHAKGWSELKGFALAFQFNPRSPLSDADFATFHTLVGDAPELDAAEAAAYVADLEAARDLLEAAYGFAAEDVQAW